MNEPKAKRQKMSATYETIDDTRYAIEGLVSIGCFSIYTGDILDELRINTKEYLRDNHELKELEMNSRNRDFDGSRRFASTHEILEFITSGLNGNVVFRYHPYVGYNRYQIFIRKSAN